MLEELKLAKRKALHVDLKSLLAMWSSIVTFAGLFFTPADQKEGAFVQPDKAAASKNKKKKKQAVTTIEYDLEALA